MCEEHAWIIRHQPRKKASVVVLFINFSLVDKIERAFSSQSQILEYQRQNKRNYKQYIDYLETGPYVHKVDFY